MARVLIGNVKPKRGIDYFTKQEVEDIANDVKEEL